MDFVDSRPSPVTSPRTPGGDRGWADLLPTPEPAIGHVGGFVLVWGWSLWETSGVAPATINLYSGTDTSGLLVARINLSASESRVDGVWPHPLIFPGGYLAVASAGAAAGTVWITPTTPNALDLYGRIR